MADDDLDPVLDLRLERVVPVEAAALWRGWTEPALLVQWFTPAPWVTTEAEVDLRPGGVFRTVMRSPDGETGETAAGCVLEVFEFEPVEGGTRYRATARHGSEADARLHAEMGFAAGWGAAFDQLVALVG